MLTHMRLVNFKSWADTGSIRLAPITGFFGPNSSGKTSLLQALLLLKQTAASADRNQPLFFGTAESPVDLGDFISIIHGHTLNSTLTLEIEWSSEELAMSPDPGKPGMALAHGRRTRFATILGAESGSGVTPHVMVNRLSYALDSAEFGMRCVEGSEKEFELYSSGRDFQFRHTAGHPVLLPAPTKCYGFPDQVRAYYQNAGFLSDLELALEQELRRVYYLGPLRAYPERGYTWSGTLPTDVGREGELAIRALLAARELGDRISQGRGKPQLLLEIYVEQWLKELGLISEFQIKAVAEGGRFYEALVRKSPRAPEVLITDVGFGVSQILPVIVLCFYVPEGSTIIFEQPEIHLHPAVQSGLADVFIDAVKKRHVQIVVESHSEHLLRRLQRRIADETLAATDAALYFCDASSESSTLTELRLDPLGNITNWPEDFFGDPFGELAATQKARLKRMQAAG